MECFIIETVAFQRKTSFPDTEPVGGVRMLWGPFPGRGTAEKWLEDLRLVPDPHLPRAYCVSTGDDCKDRHTAWGCRWIIQEACDPAESTD